MGYGYIIHPYLKLKRYPFLKILLWGFSLPARYKKGRAVRPCLVNREEKEGYSESPYGCITFVKVQTSLTSQSRVVVFTPTTAQKQGYPGIIQLKSPEGKGNSVSRYQKGGIL